MLLTSLVNRFVRVSGLTLVNVDHIVCMALHVRFNENASEQQEEYFTIELVNGRQFEISALYYPHEFTALKELLAWGTPDFGQIVAKKKTEAAMLGTPVQKGINK